ncbi:hypothetical protein NPIL_270781 [Nephila pilipes]|uniref:Uncharacterized protein n=1 Tax=Nephila pilipes TaxID=299642 RepID=A0A8X6IH08_NEPPI|nr:hypothetical protein NPIL_270781 [Nephila pilipes]
MTTAKAKEWETQNILFFPLPFLFHSLPPSSSFSKRWWVDGGKNEITCGIRKEERDGVVMTTWHRANARGWAREIDAPPRWPCPSVLNASAGIGGIPERVEEGFSASFPSFLLLAEI